MDDAVGFRQRGQNKAVVGRLRCESITIAARYSSFAMTDNQAVVADCVQLWVSQTIEFLIRGAANIKDNVHTTRGIARHWLHWSLRIRPFCNPRMHREKERRNKQLSFRRRGEIVNLPDFEVGQEGPTH